MKAAVLFAGLGGLSLGYQRAGFQIVGAVDSDPAACRDHELLTGVPATVADLSTMTPQELRAACGGVCPDVVATSPPCRGFSGCLPQALASTPKYQDLNDLALRGIWLALEAWDTPPALIILENVPRIQSRGRRWLDIAQGLLRSYGYAVQETVHDCGELGGLAQRRRRFLMVARHMEQCPALLFTPKLRPLRGVGEVLGELPVPTPGVGDDGGPMHRLNKMSPLNWVRLALIPAGGDWRDLPEQAALAPRAARQNGGYGINEWDGQAHTVVASNTVRDTWASIADPRLSCAPRSGVYGVLDGAEPAGTVVGAARNDNGAYSVADPRINQPRREGSLGVTGWDDASTTVIANGRPCNGPWQVADPRLDHSPRRGSWGVTGWATPTHTIISAVQPDKGFNVADPRVPLVVGPELDLSTSGRPCHLVIRAADGTWHRPLTTLELAVLQGLPARVGGEWLKLDGGSQQGWRQRIGNAVPPAAAEAGAREMRRTLEAAAGGGWLLGSTPVWVERRAL